jgi:hypothetical protein
MKKLLVLLFTFYCTLSFSQNLVDTIITKKNALIEEFTAAGCGNCPTGHSTVTVIENENPGQIVSIRYHRGTLSTPIGDDFDFRTDFSDAFANLANAIGQQLATVNRHLFSGQNTSQVYSQWEASCLEIIEQNAVVNIGATAVIDSSTNELEIMVELYYTGTQTIPSNLLNIALLQNNIISSQAVYTVPQPNDFLESGLYAHKHVFRQLITGQWGISIDLNDGPFIDKKFNYSIPTHFRNIPVDLNNLDLAIFINEGENEVLNTISITPEFGTIESASNSDSENNSIKTFPNPASKYEQITIETNSKNISQINILDITGNIVYQDNFFYEKSAIQLNSSKFKSGIYLIQLIQGEKRISNQKLIIY